jgi:hypothetical protein
MNQFGLIIQETTAGSNQQFVSAHLDINSPEIKETITDERTLASQLANLSDVYSVQVTKNYKVYSLIVTNLTDFLGRSGYYAIRLYGPKGVNLTNFESILANVKEKYNNYTKSNTLNNQNYEDILSSILIVENDRKNIVAVKSTVNCFYYFDDANSTLSTVFNTKGVNLVHKIYAFNRNKAVNESIALASGLKSFSQINTSQKEINIVNNYGVLNELKINDQLIDFNPNLTEFNVLCQNNDVVVYNAKDDKTYKTITNNFISIEKKFVPRPQPQNTYHSSNNRKKKNNANAMYLIVGLMVLVIGGGIFYYLNQDTPPIATQNYETNDTIVGHEVTGDSITEGIEFKEKLNSITGNKEYTTKNSKLSQYIFVFAGGQWSYCDTKGTNRMGDFNERNLMNFDLTPEEKKSFIEKLGEISNHKKLEEEIKVKANIIKESVAIVNNPSAGSNGKQKQSTIDKNKTNLINHDAVDDVKNNGLNQIK